MKKIYLLLFSVLLMSSVVYSQSPTCAGASPFCAGGSTFTFPNSTGIPSTSSPGCLGSAPNQAWFYMQIAVSGSISFYMTQGNNPPNYDNLDVDFICWGPFNVSPGQSPSPQCGALYDVPDGNTGIPNNVVGCSYSANPTESFTLPNALAGQVYVVLITNYSNNPGQITLTQTNAGQGGAGSTDCNILCPLSLADEVICPGNQAILTATIAGAVSYQWSSSVSGPIISNTQSIVVTQAATYTVVVNKPGCVANSSASAIVSYAAAPAIQPPSNYSQCSNIPNFNLTLNSTSIFNGTGLTPGDYDISYHHSAIDAQNIANPITNASSYPTTATVGNPENIYLSITDNTSGGCVFAFSFTLTLTICQATPVSPGPLHECDISVAPTDDAFFDFTPQTAAALGTNPPANYTITYHLSLADADNDVSPISPINNFANTSNPQTIYIRMEEVANAATYGTTSFQLIVDPSPTVTISGSTTICAGGDAVITFNGTPGAVIDYTVDTVAAQITLPAAGTETLTTPFLSTTSIYSLVGVTNPTTTCTQTQSGSATVSVTPLPTATITGTMAVCKNATSPSITFTGADGIAPYTFTYTINSGANQTVTTTVGNSVTVAALTTAAGTFTYDLVSVSSSTAPVCSQTQTGSAIITVNDLPTATISGTIAVCLNDTNPLITFTGANGTAPYTFTYTINSGANQTITTTSGNSATVAVPTTTVTTYTYDLVSVQDGSSTTCLQAQAGTAVVTVNDAPIINNPTPYEVCDDNNDGLSCLFILTTKDNEITGGNPNIVVTYHETLTNSQTGANPKSSPYCTIDNTGLQTLYVRAYNVGSSACYTNTTLQLVVNQRPMPNPVIADYELCDANLVPGIGMEVFDLSTKSTEIANGLVGVTVNYYGNQPDAIAQTNPLPNFYTNSSSPEQIWINISDNATGCNSVSSFNLVVHPLPSVVAPTPMFECSNGVSNQALFNLSLNDGTISNGAPGVTVTYYNSLNDAQSETAAISSTSYLGTDNEIVFVRVENDATGCFDTTTLLLRVTQGPLAVTPQPQQYCDPNNDGFGVFDLEASTNEIAGGVLPPGVTVTYHETQTDAQIGSSPLVSPYPNINPWTQPIYVRVFYTLTGCSNYVTLQLIVNPTPEATTPADYHTCDDDYDGIANFDLTTRINEVLGAIDPTTHTISFYTSLLNAQTPSNAIVNLTNYNATTNQTIWIRVETNATGCFDIVTLQLVVDPLPNATQPNYPQYSLCDTTAPIGYEIFDLDSQINAISLGQTGMNVTFHANQADADADANALPLMYQNSPIYVQTLFIRVENASTGCFVVSTMDIRVEPLPTPIPPTQPYTVCDDNQDGYTDFDLTSLTAAILQGANYTITYHETPTDAQLGDFPLASPYPNITAFIQFIYVRAVNPLTGCITVMTIELNADPSPEMSMTLSDLTNCDQDNNTQDGRTNFDLTQQTPLILAAQSSPAADYAVTYHINQGDAQAGVPVIIPPTSYTNNTAGQTIWARVEHNTTGCYNIGSFQLHVNAPLALTTPTPLSICDNDTNPNDLHTTFDLSVKNATITQGLSGYTVTYYPSYPVTASSVAIADPLAYINTTAAVQTLGVMVTSAQGCKSYTTLDIRVLPVPTPGTNPPPLAPKCDDNNPGDMVEVFDLTTNAAYIINNDPNVTLHYFATYANAVANTSELIPANAASVGQDVWIRVENNRVDYQGNNCFVLVKQKLQVNPLPTVVQAPTLLPYYACDNDADGISTFDLQTQSENLLGATQATTDYTVSFYVTAQGADPDTNVGEQPLPLTGYQNVIPFQQDVYVRIVNNTTGCVNPAGVLTLIVEQAAVANSVSFPPICDNYTDLHDGIGLVDLTPYGTMVLGTQDPTQFLLSYYHTLGEAESGVAIPGTEISDPANYVTFIADNDTVYIRVTNSATTSPCYAVAPLAIHIERYADPIIETQNNIHTICVDHTNPLNIFRDLLLEATNTVPGNYTYQWFENGNLIPFETNPTYLVDTATTAGATRVYTVEMTSVAFGCAIVSPTFDVIQSGPAVIATGTIGYTVTNAFEQNQIITVNVEGYGIYQYSLDDGPRQDSNVFENVNLGMHVITVWDTQGGLIYSCDSLIILEVQIIDYPHYFTPNGDGINDTWNIDGLHRQADTKIYIFDRYGKLLKQISSTGNGWDGTFNGKLMPSTDYWFTIDFAENNLSIPVAKQFKAHFSLKR